jgi:predicted metalloendopeptidase
LLAGALLVSTAAPAFAQPATPTTATATATAEIVGGIDLANLDLAVDPAADFNQFVNGGWLDRTTIRPDRSSAGAFQELDDATTDFLIDLLQRTGESGELEPESDQAKAVAFFEQGMDQAERDRLGVEPIQPLLDRVAAIDSLAAFHDYQRDSLFDGVSGALSMGVGIDPADSNRHVLYLGGPWYGMPNRDYYLDEAIGTPELREAYVATTADLLELAGYDADEAARHAQAVFDLEADLVAPTLTREEEQDPNLSNNPRTLAELQAAYPAMDWTAAQEALGIPVQDRIIVSQIGYLDALPEILEGADLETLKAWLTTEIMWTWAGVLSDEVGETAFAFGQALSGQEQRSPLDERVLSRVEGALGDAVGQLYVAERFPPAAKAEMERLTADIIAAFRLRLEANPWMTEATKARALEKLAAMVVKVGYPDEWETYEDVLVGPSFADTAISAFRARAREDLDEIDEPVDRTEWFANAQTVNAYYSPVLNEIVFPAGILQPPFFDLQADPAVNYGAIGFVIGHEITHGFDLEGSQFDAQGNLDNWWTDEDRERFLALNEALAAQYAAIEVAPGLFVNGQLTVTENAADLGGIQVAWDALQTRLAEEGIATPVAATPIADAGDVVIAPPFTPAQEFAIAAATVWRQKIRDAALATQVNSGVHAPGSVRAVQPLRNLDAFYAAFGIGPGDPMWLAPEDRVVIW